MFAVHALQDVVAARLHRQVQIRHQLFARPVRLNQILAHIVGVGCGKPDPLQPVDIVERPDQLCQAPCISTGASPVIGVHILPQKGDLPHATLHEVLRLVQNARGRTAHLGTTRIRHHAEGTELVASLLHGQKGRRRALGLWAFLEDLEFVLNREIRIERFFPAAGFGFELWQFVIALRPHHQINKRLAAHNLFAFGLRHTARHTDFQVRVFVFQFPKPAKLRINLLGRLFPNVAGVEQDHIRIVWGFRFDIPGAAHGFGHTLTVVDVHLTAIGLDKEFLRLRFRVGHSVPALDRAR